MVKLVDVTPTALKCDGAVPACPALFKGEDKYVVIGPVVDVSVYEELKDRIGVGEIAIEVPAELLSQITNLQARGLIGKDE